MIETTKTDQALAECTELLNKINNETDIDKKLQIIGKIFVPLDFLGQLAEKDFEYEQRIVLSGIERQIDDLNIVYECTNAALLPPPPETRAHRGHYFNFLL